MKAKPITKETPLGEGENTGEGSGSEGDQISYTDQQAQFLELLKKYPVKLPETIVDYVTSQGEDVLESPVKLAVALRECDITPVRRHQILKHWFADKGIAVSKELLQQVVLDRPSEQSSEGDNKGKTPKEKYTIDQATGSIMIASSDNNAVTYDEAVKLSDKRKVEIKEQGKGVVTRYAYDPEAKVVRMAKEGEQGGTLDEAKELKKMAEEGTKKGGSTPLYVYDAVEKVVRMAKDGEQGGTLDEAKELKRLVELDTKAMGDKGVVKYVYDTEAKVIRMAKEGEPGGTFDDAERLKRMAEGNNKDKGESPFTMDANGNILIAPGAKLTAQDLMVWQSLQKPASGDSEAMKTLNTKIDKMIEDMHKEETARLNATIAALTTQVENSKTEMSSLKESVEKNRATTGKTAYDLLAVAVDRIPKTEEIKDIVKHAMSNPPKILPGGAGDRSKALETVANKLEQVGAIQKAENAWFNLV